MKTFKTISLLFSLVILAGSFCHAAGIDVRIENDKIAITASEASLKQIIDAVSHKTGIVFKTSARLNHSVTVDIKSVPVEEGLHRLLNRCNYAVFYGPGEGDRSISEIWVFGTKSNPTESLATTNPQEAPQFADDALPTQDDHIKRLDKDWFEKQIRDKRLLEKQISGVLEIVSNEDAAHDPEIMPVFEESDSAVMPPPKTGLRITAVSQNSLFDKMGIGEGDLIEDVNGFPVESESQLVKVLDTDMSILRIGRIDDGGRMDAIYVELQ